MNNKEIKKGRHPRVFLSGISLIDYINKGKSLWINNKKAGDSRQRPSGMTTLFNNGFTLIELLVVVLIIGILAAIALPQYQMAVAKARYTNLMILSESIYKAQEAYKLANEQYSMDFYSLDVSLPADFQPVRVTSKEETYMMANSNIECYFATGDYGDNGSGVFCALRKGGIEAMYGHWYGGKGTCIANNTNEKQNALCKKMTGQTSVSSVNGTWNLYNF